MAAPSNPFAQPSGSQAPFNPFAQVGSTGSAGSRNPFAAATVSSEIQQPVGAFQAAQPQRSVSLFAQPLQTKSEIVKNPFAKDVVPAASFTVAQPAQAASNAIFAPPKWTQPSGSTTNSIFGASPNPSVSDSKRKIGSQSQQQSTQRAKLTSFRAPVSLTSTAPAISGGTLGQIPKTANSETRSDFAKKVYSELAKAGINPPQWPANPGSKSQRKAMDAFRQAYRAYRDKARKCLTQAGLIDDPEKRRRLDEAIEFHGICEDMCPDWEKIERITELDVKKEEMEERNGETVAKPEAMVKRLARSAAGQDAPLPMDVLSPATIRKALDYMIDDLIYADDCLPVRHNFLWDRTRALRRDFVFQAPSMNAEGIKDQIYCLETIARFHVTALHLLSQADFAAEDFSPTQEREQLNNTLLSLMHTYDDCAKDGIECPNEAEFRAYYCLFSARNPALEETVQGWGLHFWDSDVVRTAMSLAQAFQNASSLQGPLVPLAATEVALNAASTFFDMVASPKISYTMACFAEIHFNEVRQSILETIVQAYSRPKDGPRDLTPALLQELLRFDEEQETIDFVEQHGLGFEEGSGDMFLVISPRQHITKPRVPQHFSYELVESKRGDRSLPEIIHETVFHQTEPQTPVGETKKAGNSVHGPPSSSRGATTSTKEVAHNTPASFLAPATQTSSITSTSKQPFPPSTGNGINGPSSTPGSSMPQETQTPALATNASAPPSLFSNLASSSMKTSIFASPIGANLSSQPPQAPDGSSGLGKKVKFGENTYIEPPPSQPLFFGANAISTTPNSFPPQSSVSNTGEHGNHGSPAPQWPATPVETSATPPMVSTASASNPSPAPAAFAPAQSTIPPRPASLFAPVAGTAIFALPNEHSSATATADRQEPNVENVSSTASGPLFGGFQPPSATNFVPASHASSRAQLDLASKAPAPPQPPRDRLGDFTRWYVCADQGLMHDVLEPWVLETILRNVYDEFHEEEARRQREEEDQRSWEEARKFRTYSLRVTFFYRWLDIFRKRRVIKRIQQEKEKARQWRLPENVARREIEESVEREGKDKEVVDLLRQSARGKAVEEKRLGESERKNWRSSEDSLLATRVLGGISNARELARTVVSAEQGEPRSMPASESTLLRLENQRRKKRGLPPAKRLTRPPDYKQGSKSAKLKALSDGTESLSISTGSFRNSTFSSSYRSSLGFNSGRVSKSKSGRVSDPYWKLKANGLVQMPNGEYLHESLAMPMLREGKRFPGLGDFGLPPAASATPSMSPLIRADLLDYSPNSYLNTSTNRRDRVSTSPSIVSASGARRKRLRTDLHEEADEDLAAYRSESAAAGRKRAKSGDSTGSDKDFLSRMDSLLADIEAENQR